MQKFSPLFACSHQSPITCFPCRFYIHPSSPNMPQEFPNRRYVSQFLIVISIVFSPARIIIARSLIIACSYVCFLPCLVAPTSIPCHLRLLVLPACSPRYPRFCLLVPRLDHDSCSPC